MEQDKIINHENDEINLFESSQIIWKGKLWILLVTSICVAFSTGYILITPKIYEVKVQVYLHPDVDPNLLNSFDQEKNNQWNLDLKFRILTLNTMQLRESEIYLNELKQSAVATIGQMAVLKKIELEEISTLHPALLSTEEVAKISLANRRFLKIADSPDSPPIRFGEPIIKVKSPKSGFIIGLAAILGCMIGIISVLIANAYKDYANQRKS